MGPQLLELIGAIYDCVIEPERWEETLDRVRRSLDMHNGLLGVASLPSGATVVKVSCGVPPEYQHMFGSFHEDGLDVWGGLEALPRVTLEEPMVQSRATPNHGERWARSTYVQRFAVPQGIVDSVAMVLARDHTMYAGLEFSMHRSRDPVGDAEIETLRVLAPHFRRAATITRLLDDAAVRTQTFSSVLEACSSGIVLVDAEMHIVHANAAAAAMLAAGDPVRERNGSLQPSREVFPRRLEAAVSAAAGDDRAGRIGLGIPARWRDGTPLVLHVLPLERRQVRPDLTQRAVAAVFIAESSAPPRLPADAVGALYMLTPAETRVFELLATGHTLPEIAGRMSSTTNTVRTHLQRVFDKTGCHRQAELVTLAQRIELPVLL